jgi:hypothetical protein
VDVIEFPWRVWYYADRGRPTVVNAWLNEIGASEADRSQLSALLLIFKHSGLRAIASYVEDIGDDLLVLHSTRKGGLSLALIFCSGPFSDTEITFLQGAILRGKELRPYSAKGAARENLEMLRQEPHRRCYERIG